MSDISDTKSSHPVKIVGSEVDGTETTPVNSSNNQEIFIRDTHDNGGTDTIIVISDATPVEGVVNIIPKSLRKYVIIEALTTGMKWGFSSSSQSFDIFKSQLIMVPIGENTQIWFKAPASGGEVAFGELS